MTDTIPAPLKGKIAIITGASRGIGASVVDVFTRHGCSHIAITYVSNQDKAEAVLEAAKKINPKLKTTVIKADVTDIDFGQKVVQGAIQGLGVDHLDIIVGNAAKLDLMSWPDMEDMDYAHWDFVIRGSCWCQLNLALAAKPYLRSGGRLIFMSSAASKLPMPNKKNIAYCAGKAALDAVSRCLAAMYGPQDNITVNTISIGATRTDALQSAFDKLEGFTEETAGQFSLLKRIAEAEEVANITAFVASPQAGWITGNQIPANGGTLSMLQS
jgi:3-oxoacyl-[acyl-carrier protein] reductase